MSVGQPLAEPAGTVEFWVNRGAVTDGSDVLFGSGPTGLNGRTPGLYVRSSDTLIWEFNEVVLQDTGRLLPTGEWHHLAMTWSSRGGYRVIDVYLDGDHVGSGSAVGGMPWIDPYVGAYHIPGGVEQFANARIDELSIYNRPLTQAEIQAIYAAGLAAKCKDNDGDGSPWPADCNDADPRIHPAAPEACDGQDNNCDGLIDNSAECVRACLQPEKRGPEIPVTDDPGQSYYPRLIWTGSEYGVAWEDNRDGNFEIYFARLDAAGVKIGGDVRVTNDAAFSGLPVMVWTGAQFALAWMDERDGELEIYVTLLSPDGVKIGGDLRVTSDAADSTGPTLTWNGNELALAWQDSRDGIPEIYYARLDRTGMKLGADVRITTDPAGSFEPALVWAGSSYGLAWYDYRSGTQAVYFTRISAEGVKVGTDIKETSEPIGSLRPGLVWTGSQYGLAWSDVRWGDGEIYFARLDSGGVRVGPETRATNNPADQILSSLAWSGEQYALAWYDYRDGAPKIYVRLLGNLGGTVGPETPVTDEPAGALDPSLAWTGSGFSLAWSDGRGGPTPNLDVYFASVVCCPDSDGDGYARCTDCDDSNPAVHPGAVEICNGLDDNCSGQTDEGFGRITCGLGICRRTVDQCLGGVPQACIPGVPGVEICDGLDNDCNSLIDDDSAGLDSDIDGIHNVCDNCRLAYNPTQQDTDHDGFGNACDNCVGVSNANQADLDVDLIGDLCDDCPAQYNPSQADLDADTIGDVCDNCLNMSNPDQGDFDRDFEGDVCDLNDGLIVINLTDDVTVEWQQEAGFDAFNLYRGDMAVLRSSGLYTQDPSVVPLAGRECGLTDVFSFDDSEPPVGKAVFFLVSGVHLGVEGSLGKNSAGAERGNTNPCP